VIKKHPHNLQLGEVCGEEGRNRIPGQEDVSLIKSKKYVKEDKIMDSFLQLLSKHRTSIMGFAIIWVMLFHLPPINSGYFPIDFFKTIGYGGVDIFLFLSGFGLYFSMSKPNCSLRQYYRSRLIRILPEFWIVICVVFLLKMNFSTRSFILFIGEASTLGYWVWGFPMELWYISCILFLYVIFPFYFKLFKKKGMQVSVAFIAGGGGLILIYALICILFFDKKNVGGIAILTYARIPIFFIGAVFGHWAKDGVIWKLTKKMKIIGLTTSAMATFALACFIKYIPTETLWVCSLYFIPFIFITPVLCFVLAICFDKLKNISKIFNHIGLISLELYMCHVYLYKSGLVKYISDYMNRYLSWFFVCLVSFIVAYALFILNKKIKRLF